MGVLCSESNPRVIINDLPAGGLLSPGKAPARAFHPAARRSQYLIPHFSRVLSERLPRRFNDANIQYLFDRYLTASRRDEIYVNYGVDGKGFSSDALTTLNSPLRLRRHLFIYRGIINHSIYESTVSGADDFFINYIKLFYIYFGHRIFICLVHF